MLISATSTASSPKLMLADTEGSDTKKSPSSVKPNSNSRKIPPSSTNVLTSPLYSSRLAMSTPISCRASIFKASLKASSLREIVCMNEPISSLARYCFKLSSEKNETPSISKASAVDVRPLNWSARSLTFPARMESPLIPRTSATVLPVNGISISRRSSIF